MSEDLSEYNASLRRLAEMSQEQWHETAVKVSEIARLLRLLAEVDVSKFEGVASAIEKWIEEVKFFFAYLDESETPWTEEQIRESFPML